jgi:hypothetical protein
MKLVVRLFLVCVSSLGCDNAGDDDQAAVTCPSEVVGTWDGEPQNDQITILSDGSFSYSGVSGCVSNGSFMCPEKDLTAGAMEVSIDSSSGAGCLPVGHYTCAFTLEEAVMSYDCTGLGSLQYRRKS